MRKPYFIAIYVDLENLDSKFEVAPLFEDVLLKIKDPELTPIFAIKLACGDTKNIARFRKQLLNQNFDIRETPHVSEGNLKNRADLILSVEAFESLYLDSPPLDLYVFITSDTDFTVVMDKLRKYGKEVWLVTKQQNSQHKLFNSSSDQVLIIEEYFSESGNNEKKKKQASSYNFLSSHGFMKTDIQHISKIMDSFEKDSWEAYSTFGNKMKNTNKSFTYKGKKLNSQKKFFAELEKNKLIEVRKTGTIDEFKVIG